MAQEERNVHTGHRQRLYDSFRKTELDGFSQVTALELLLTYAIPRKDTNPLAHRLLDAFGSLHAVFDAPVESLLAVEGMTERSAILVHLLPQLWKRCDESRQSTAKILRTTKECGDFLQPKVRGCRTEQVWLLCLDAKCKQLDCRLLGEGGVNETPLPVRRILEIVLSVNAVSVVIAHNHTSGLALPSNEDVAATRMLQEVLKSVDVILADHLIFADGDYVSMRDSGLLNTYRF